MTVSSGILVYIFSLLALGAAYRLESPEVNLQVLPRPDTTVRLECTVVGDDFNAYNHIVEWHKMQLELDDVGVKISTGGRLESVFTDTGRYKVNVAEETTPVKQVSFTLVISDVKPEDSGRYNCKVDGGGSSQLSITHRLSVFAPVESVVMFGYPLAEDKPANPNVTETPAEIQYRNGREGYFECRVTGGLPRPSVRLMLDDQQFTGSSRMEVANEVMLSGEPLGLQTITHVVRAFSTKFSPTVFDQGRTITCRAEVKVNEAVESSKQTKSRLSIQGAPVFDNCTQEVKAGLGAKDVTLSCEFYSMPEMDSVKWVGMTTDKEIPAASSNSQMEGNFMAYTQALAGSSRYRAVLKIAKAEYIDFQVYKLEVRNQLGTRDISIELMQGQGSSGNSTDSGVLHAAAPWCLLLAAITSVLATRWH